MSECWNTDLAVIVINLNHFCETCVDFKYNLGALQPSNIFPTSDAYRTVDNVEKAMNDGTGS
jgi:hypothetical protein